MRDLEFRGRVVCVCQKLAEFRLVDSRKWLIGSDNPLGKQVLKGFLIPWALENANTLTPSKHGLSSKVFTYRFDLHLLFKHALDILVGRLHLTDKLRYGLRINYFLSRCD